MKGSAEETAQRARSRLLPRRERPLPLQAATGFLPDRSRLSGLSPLPEWPERPGDAQQRRAHQHGDEDQKRVQLYGAAVDHRLEDAALHLLVDEDVDEKDYGRPQADKEAHNDQQRPT